MDVNKLLESAFQGIDADKLDKVMKFLSNKVLDLYNSDLMDKQLIIENAVNGIVFNIPNAKENQAYEYTVTLPDTHKDMRIVSVEGIQEDIHGIKILVAEDRRSFTICGIPTLENLRKEEGAIVESTFELKLCYKYDGVDFANDRPYLERAIPFVINQDPRKLWKNLVVDWENMPEPKYQKEDEAIEYVKVEANSDGQPQKDIVSASVRGRSHAQEGKPRDDHFKNTHLENGWYVMAVADGAGSAKYSREGSRIACETAVAHCKEQLEVCRQIFEENITLYHLSNQDNSESEARKMVGDFIYKIVGTAAFKAQKTIFEEANKQQLSPKLYATTLLLTISKQFSFGWFIASFWVGDGAIGLYNANPSTIRILGTPDEGEYAGQTRFLTMPEIFQDATAIYQRLRFAIVPDFTALFLMSDGVSDPKFETDANLNTPDKWDALWSDLKGNGVELTDDNEDAKNQLRKWLDFWSPGNHDDRTITILY